MDAVISCVERFSLAIIRLMKQNGRDYTHTQTPRPFAFTQTIQNNSNTLIGRDSSGKLLLVWQLEAYQA